MRESWTTSDESAFAALAVVVSAIACAAMWGFTVDDALISVRYAQSLARGAGWRFDPSGPATDGVTPLPWPLVLAPLSFGDALDALDRARVFGVCAVLASMAWLGRAIGRTDAPRAAKLACVLSLGASVPLAAHASSGMETALVIALATLAATTERAQPYLAGACAAMRPEMIPWAITLTAARSRQLGPSLACALFPASVIALRLALFGHGAPLAVQAKPSDLEHGIAYALAGLVTSALPVLALARPRGAAIAITSAAGAHVLAIVLAGGDWMPYARLFTPIVPGLAYAAALSTPRGVWLGARVAIALALGAWMWLVAAPLGRAVARDRRDLVLRARPLLAGRKLATIDVGWASAATSSVVDLAGLTDPEIAALPGGHTSKRVDAAMLLDRGVEVVALYASSKPEDWKRAPYARASELRLARSELFRARYGSPRWLPLSHGTGYVLVFRREP